MTTTKKMMMKTRPHQANRQLWTMTMTRVRHQHQQPNASLCKHFCRKCYSHCDVKSKWVEVDERLEVCRVEKRVTGGVAVLVELERA